MRDWRSSSKKRKREREEERNGGEKAEKIVKRRRESQSKSVKTIRRTAVLSKNWELLYLLSDVLNN